MKRQVLFWTVLLGGIAYALPTGEMCKRQQQRLATTSMIGLIFFVVTVGVGWLFANRRRSD